MQEGLSLVKHGVSPYSGDVVHEVRFENVVILGSFRLDYEYGIENEYDF